MIAPILPRIIGVAAHDLTIVAGSITMALIIPGGSE